MKPNFERDPADLDRVLTWTGYGKVVELSPTQAAVLATHIAAHTHTQSVAASGLPPQTFSLFGNGPTVGVEWIRREPNPKATEPPLNVNRYLFGLSPDGQKCWGFEVTEKDGQLDPVPGTVFPHWPKDFGKLWACHFPPTQPDPAAQGNSAPASSSASQKLV